MASEELNAGSNVSIGYGAIAVEARAVQAEGEANTAAYQAEAAVFLRTPQDKTVTAGDTEPAQ